MRCGARRRRRSVLDLDGRVVRDQEKSIGSFDEHRNGRHAGESPHVTGDSRPASKRSVADWRREGTTFASIVAQSETMEGPMRTVTAACPSSRGAH